MTRKSRTSERLGEALFALLTESGSREEVMKIVREFKETYPRSYEGVKKQPFACRLIEAIENADRYMNNMDAE